MDVDHRLRPEDRTPTRGYEPTCAAMTAFAKSWRRCHWRGRWRRDSAPGAPRAPMAVLQASRMLPGSTTGKRFCQDSSILSLLLGKRTGQTP